MYTRTQKGLRHLMLRALVVGVLASPVSAWAISAQEIVVMAQSGIPDAIIVQQIQAQGAGWSLSPAELQQMQAAGVSATVLQAAIAASGSMAVTR